MVKLTDHESLRRGPTISSRGARTCGHPKVDGECVARMEDGSISAAPDPDAPSRSVTARAHRPASRARTHERSPQRTVNSRRRRHGPGARSRHRAAGSRRTPTAARTVESIPDRGIRGAGQLSTHSEAPSKPPPAEARRSRRLEFHYTPKQPVAQQVEIEIGGCAARPGPQDRRPTGPRPPPEFTTDKARAKMGRAYPVTSKES